MASSPAPARTPYRIPWRVVLTSEEQEAIRRKEINRMRERCWIGPEPGVKMPCERAAKVLPGAEHLARGKPSLHKIEKRRQRAVEKGYLKMSWKQRVEQQQLVFQANELLDEARAEYKRAVDKNVEAELRRLQCQPALLAAATQTSEALRIAERAIRRNMQMAAEGEGLALRAPVEQLAHPLVRAKMAAVCTEDMAVARTELAHVLSALAKVDGTP